MVTMYQCSQKKGKLTSVDLPLEPLKAHDIQIKITHCGICHSDIHLIDNDWDISEYPIVPGHEIVGIIEKVGGLSDHKVGQRVGIGWQGKSCMDCEWCLCGDENLCASQEGTCVGHQGGFAEKIVADGRFAFLIPEGLDSAHAAPLLCGGATVFSPFVEHKITAQSRVAVVGIGGLGHLALQFARAYGCDVTAISSSKDKEKEAKEFGADHFILTKNIENHPNQFDLILSTSTAPLKWQSFIKALRPRGKLCLLGIPTEALEIPVMDLVDCRKSICGSNIASRPVIKEMLDLAARKNIHPKIEEYPMNRINEAIEKVRSGKMRYRAVLFNNDLKTV